MGKTSVITTGRRCARFLSVQQYMNPASEGGLAVNKVIFLDVDGVLNNGTRAIEMFDKGIRVYHDDLLYEPSLKQLKRIVDTTGAFIVEKYGMEIYDKTPYVGGERGDDITAWFNRHPGDWKYVILDDDDDMGVHMPHLVRTSFDEGLTMKEANCCIELLND